MTKGFSFVEESANDLSPETTQAIMTYELGHVIEYHLKARLYGAVGYYSDINQQKEMSDLISMCRMYCEQKCWNYETLEDIGERAYLERMQDIRRHALQKSLENREANGE